MSEPKTREYRPDDWKCPLCGKTVTPRNRFVTRQDGTRGFGGHYYSCPTKGCELDGQYYYMSIDSMRTRLIFGQDGQPINP